MCSSQKPRYEPRLQRQPLGLTLATWVAELLVASWQLAAQQNLSLAVPPNAYSHQPLTSWAYPQASGQAGSKAALRCLARKRRLGGGWIP